MKLPSSHSYLDRFRFSFLFKYFGWADFLLLYYVSCSEYLYQICHVEPSFSALGER